MNEADDTNLRLVALEENGDGVDIMVVGVVFDGVGHGRRGKGGVYSIILPFSCFL